jgi:hypothetical protein
MDVTKNEGGLSEADAVNLFARLDGPQDDEEKKKTPDLSDDKDGDDTDNKAEDTEETKDAEEGDEESTDDSDEDTEDESETKDEADALDDERVVKVPVNGEEREFTIGALKRLAGQEAALTHKSQEVATARKQLDDTARVHVAALDKMLERARKRYEPYSKIDFLLASKDPNITGEELSAVRAQANAAYEDVKFLEQELGEFSQQLTARERQELGKQAVECIKTLSDPEKGIPGWSEQLYMDMRKYAVDSGIDVQAFDRTVDPSTIKLLHKAYLYDKGQKKVQTTKTDKKVPKKIVKSTSSPEVAKRISKEAKGKEAANRLAKTHRMADAVDAFAERFSPASSDD